MLPTQAGMGLPRDGLAVEGAAGERKLSHHPGMPSLRRPSLVRRLGSQWGSQVCSTATSRTPVMRGNRWRTRLQLPSGRRRSSPGRGGRGAFALAHETLVN